MEAIIWTSKYDIGIDEIDQQHKKLVTLINGLYAAMIRPGSHQQTAAVITEVIDYTKVHFAIEECLLRMCEYADYDRHKAEHDRFIAEIQDIDRRYCDGDTALAMDLFTLLRDWLIRHIRETDIHYAPILRQHGAAQR